MGGRVHLLSRRGRFYWRARLLLVLARRYGRTHWGIALRTSDRALARRRRRERHRRRRKPCRIWRLYYHGARSRAEGFIGFDLPALLDGAVQGEAGALDLFRAFLLLFRRDAHDRTGPGGLSFLDAALAEGRRYEQRITAALSEAVFDRVFPRLVSALAQADRKARPADPRWRAEVRQAALILLYRLLFILYAEDRDLLAVRHAGYADYALRRLRSQAAEARDQARPLSATLTRWWDDLAALCRAIDAGDASLGLQEAAALVPWAEYASPLSAKIEAIRSHIREQARAHGWNLREDHLDDRHLVRRIVLKRVIYGTDLNPMAVELAKLSLWLHSFTVGASLSFLDHHLRTGDSLFGEFVHQAEERIRQRGAPLLLANLNALPLDYIARQKVQGTNLNFYIVEQLPILPLEAFARPIGATTAEAMIRDHVLRLSYTAHDLAPFAEDLGYHGPPFAWDAEERLHLRARLDALFFLLYGLDRDAADHILGTFPIVREEEERRFGRFRSRELILGYMAAFNAGDAESRIAA
jgi:hypothetical protein